MNKMHYGRLFAMAVLSFISMYVLMYSMVDRLENVFPSFNQFYMAALMTAPMIIIELALMSAMYESKTANAAIIFVSLIVLIACWLAIRQQTAISDKQFLKSMIPHHAGAILMCTKAPIQDAQIKDLCRSIIQGQLSEIQQMKNRLRELEK